MPLISTEPYLPALAALAKHYPVPLQGIEAVPSIQEWCKARGMPERNPHLTGKCLRCRETGEYLILLAATISDDAKDSAIAATELLSPGSPTASIQSPDAFLVYLFLHELAHALDQSRTEAACDAWAFAELPTNLRRLADWRLAARCTLTMCPS